MKAEIGIPLGLNGLYTNLGSRSPEVKYRGIYTQDCRVTLMSFEAITYR